MILINILIVLVVMCLLFACFGAALQNDLDEMAQKDPKLRKHFKDTFNL
jgi:Tfp pilus assembly protein PilO